ncbi:MAG TPA: type II toxin-antitoxin system VapB family antitoxin [Membranihabitans sp.]|nr:type II toxin-antitoxin system VapB family antitoxin [Membranihabitans sp.]
MVNIEEKNAGIAGVLSSIFDEESRHFFVQKSAKFKRTGYNIDIDQKVLDEVIERSGLMTKRAAVNEALKEYLRLLKLKELAILQGQIQWEGDLNKIRSI